jgi:hypothetical protein
MPKGEYIEATRNVAPLAAIESMTDGVSARVTAPCGTEVQVEIHGVYGEFKSQLVGQREGHYLIIRTPLTPPGIATKLYRGNKVLVRYEEEGMAVGFQSDIVAAVTSPEPLLFLAPPALVEEKSLRGAKRIDSHIPCLAAVRDKSTEGTIIDISAEGCRCILPTHLANGLLHLHMGDVILIDAQLGDPPLRLPGKVRSVNMLHSSAHVGIHFEKLPPEAADRLVKYLVEQGVA